MNNSYPYTENAPPSIQEAEYFEKLFSDYWKLLETKGDDEKVFQTFFEKNPCMVPGARAEYDGWPSGHGPVKGALITQPKINGLKKRIPDFLWLAYDSLVFNPIFIEIESPNKKYFNPDGTTTRELNQARTQIEEWKAILTQPVNQLAFMRDFDVPQEVQKKRFEPIFLLIYGRRKEYEGNDWLSQKRSSLQAGSLRIMSFDRLEPIIARRNYVCCEVKAGRYIAKYLSPTFTLGPDHESLIHIEKLVDAVDSMSYTSDERKNFLKAKIPVCLEYLKRPKVDNKSFALPTARTVLKVE